MSSGSNNYPPCAGAAVDAVWKRVQVWEDALWRLVTRLRGPIPGYAYLIPKRHIAFITDFDGEESHTLGEVLARLTATLRRPVPHSSTFTSSAGAPPIHPSTWRPTGPAMPSTSRGSAARSATSPCRAAAAS